LGGGVGHVHGWAEMRLPVNVYVGDGRGGEEVAVGPRARRVVMRLPVDNVYVGDGRGKRGRWLCWPACRDGSGCSCLSGCARWVAAGWREERW